MLNNNQSLDNKEKLLSEQQDKQNEGSKVYLEIEAPNYSYVSIDDPKDYDIPKGREDQNKVNIKKLVFASLICLLFMVIELVGGYLAQSLAIMTDAAHLFSDISGFIISIFSLWLAQRKANKALTFGYSRSEVIGALGSVLLIWGLTIWLIYEAVERMVKQNFEIDAEIMLITSCIGLFCNLVMAKVLHSSGHSHSHGGHGGHGHSHGGAKTGGHGHSHGDKKEIHSHSHGEQQKINEDVEKNGHSHEDNKQQHAHGDNKEQHAHSHGINNDQHSHGKQEKNTQPKEESKEKHSHSHSHGNDEKKNHSHSHGPSQQQEEPQVNDVQAHEENVNIKAAMIHVIGDIVQSIGVIIASVIIYCKPDWKLADPICTLLFAIIVILTTFGVIKDCMVVLMEGVPIGFQLNEFEEKILNLPGVKEVHDLHIWQLSVGKSSLSCHITAENPHDTLRRATRLCRKYGIFHSTIQVEDFNKTNQRNSIKCNHDLH